MKKILHRILPILLIVVVLLSMLVFYACTLTKDNGLNIDQPDLAASAEIKGQAGSSLAFDGNMLTYWSLYGDKPQTEIIFDSPKEVNALLLNEIGYNVQQFSVYYDDGEGYKLCYRQNEIGQNRIASFYAVTANKIKIVIDKYKNNAKIADIKIYDISPIERESDLRITSYITNGSLTDYYEQNPKYVDAKCFEVITDAIFIGYANFDSQGNVNVAEDDNLDVLKELIGDKDVNIITTLGNPSDTAATLKNKKDILISNIVDFALEKKIDGIDIDWEYPANAREYAIYSEFLVSLKAALKPYDIQLSLALSPWGLNFSQEAIDSIDQVQLMAYDLFDHNGDNNSFAGSTYAAVNYMLDQGFELNQINLGISYYGRPSDASAKWYDYSNPNFTPYEYIMIQNEIYFNTPTTVRDKTLFALLKGLGGIMTFSQNEDLPMDDPLSLTAQIGKAKNTFMKEA